MAKVIVLALFLAGCSHGSSAYWGNLSQAVGADMRK